MIGIDIGITNTDAVLLRSRRIERAITSLSKKGAARKLLSILAEPGGEVAVTGAGAAKEAESLGKGKLTLIDEMGAIGIGGAKSSGLKKCIVASVGTGTAIVYADGKKCTHLGGTGIGGGTITGLGKKMLGTGDAERIAGLACLGDIRRVNITVGDVYGSGIGIVPADATASNFGKLGAGAASKATRGDLALGILCAVGETAGVLACFAARERGVKDVVFTGAVPSLSGMRQIICRTAKMFNCRAAVPACGRFSTAFGAALCREYNIYIRRKP